eukprot:6562866-Prymnesium_polylepis.1
MQAQMAPPQMMHAQQAQMAASQMMQAPQAMYATHPNMQALQATHPNMLYPGASSQASCRCCKGSRLQARPDRQRRTPQTLEHRKRPQ